jgi:excisionase family DNA binding protein
MLLNISQAAKELSVAPITIRRLVRDRVIPYRRIGCRILFTESDITDYIEAAKQPICHIEPAAGVPK